MILHINLIYALIFLFNSWMHPIHVSITNMEYIPDQEKIDVSFKIFMDDFQLLFVHLYQKNIDFKSDDNVIDNEILIDNYFKDHFKLLVNRDTCIINKRNYKRNQDAIWFFYDVELKQDIESIEIYNSILLDLYFDQKNLLIFKAQEFEKGYQFDVKNTEFKIEF